MRRQYTVLAAAVTVLFCMGGLYAWSAFVPALRTSYGFTAARTQIVFGVTIAVFAITTVIAGRLYSTCGARLLTAIGALLFGTGYWLAGTSEGDFHLILVGIGVLSGMGTGLGYAAALFSATQWFPNQRGLATGIAVAGFGGGAIALSWMVQLLEQHSWPALMIFRFVGLLYGVLLLGGAFFLFRAPLSGGVSGSAPLPPIALGRSRPFWTLATGLFVGTFAGLMVIGNLKAIGLNAGLSSETATLAISVFAAGNAAGRIIWGWLFDRIGYRTITISLVLLGIAMLLLIPAQHSAVYFTVISALVGFGFGACFVVYAAQTAVFFGVKQMERIYPLVFLGYGFSGIGGPLTGGLLFDYSGEYTAAIIAGAGIVMIGVLATHRKPSLTS